MAPRRSLRPPARPSRRAGGADPAAARVAVEAPADPHGLEALRLEIERLARRHGLRIGDWRVAAPAERRRYRRARSASA